MEANRRKRVKRIQLKAIKLSAYIKRGNLNWYALEETNEEKFLRAKNLQETEREPNGRMMITVKRYEWVKLDTDKKFTALMNKKKT